MRRETKKWLRTYVDDVMAEYAIPEERAAQDVLDTIAKLRAENRDLKARARVHYRYWHGTAWDKDEVIRAADLKNKNWSKPWRKR